MARVFKGVRRGAVTRFDKGDYGRRAGIIADIGRYRVGLKRGVGYRDVFLYRLGGFISIKKPTLSRVSCLIAG